MKGLFQDEFSSNVNQYNYLQMHNNLVRVSRKRVKREARISRFTVSNDYIVCHAQKIQGGIYQDFNILLFPAFLKYKHAIDTSFLKKIMIFRRRYNNYPVVSKMIYRKFSYNFCYAFLLTSHSNKNQDLTCKEKRDARVIFCKGMRLVTRFYDVNVGI